MVSERIRWHFKKWWDALLLGVPLPFRLPFGSRWLLGRDAIDYLLFSTGDWEPAEWRFVRRFLRPGMVVLDVGAHHGFYTLLASRLVGPEGKVIAFEPSERERKWLSKHLRLNECRNVRVEDAALGAQDGETEFFLVEGVNSGVQGIKAPEGLSDPIRRVRVPVMTLDRYVELHSLDQVDLIKLDVEGGERDVLRGARRLLDSARPVFLCEVQDIRTAKWGYEAREIISGLSERRYLWFRPAGDARLESISPTEKRYDGNFVAVPEERLSDIASLLAKDVCPA